MMRYGKGMRSLAGGAALFMLSGLSGCAYLTVKNPEEDLRLGATTKYLGIIPNEREQKIEDDLCRKPKEYAREVAKDALAKKVLTPQQAKTLVDIACFNVEE